MNPKLQSALRFLRITDEQDRLSLTNLALVAALAKLLFTPGLALPDIATFVATVIGYQVKRFATPGTSADDSAELKAALEQMQTRVAALQMGQNLKR